MATLPSPPTGLPPKDFFLGHLKLIEEIIAFCCRGSNLRPEQVEDFEGQVKIKLIQDDYAVIRQFQGRSSPKTYLTTVINHLLLDYRDSLWGKWRPCAEAKRLGPVALRLDQLVNRDGYLFTQACEILRTNEKVNLSLLELADLWAKLPPRPPRQNEGEDSLQNQPSKDLPPDKRMLVLEREGLRRRIYIALRRAIETLSSEDKLLVKMRMEYSVADIARIRRMEQKPLYRRLEKIYSSLRKELERNGVRRSDINEVLDFLEPD